MQTKCWICLYYLCTLTAFLLFEIGFLPLGLGSLAQIQICVKGGLWKCTRIYPDETFKVGGQIRFMFKKKLKLKLKLKSFFKPVSYEATRKE